MEKDAVEELLRENLSRLSRLGAVVRFDLGSDGDWLVDARTDAPTLEEDSDQDADCTIRISSENLAKLMAGRMDPMLGYAMGKIKISGSTGIAMKLVNAIG